MDEQNNSSQDSESLNQDTLTAQPQVNRKKYASKILIVFLLVLIIGVGVAFLNKDTSTQKDNQQQQITNYLSNSNDIICITVAMKTLQCENLQTDEVQRFILPQEYQDIIEINQSPDGSKFLIKTQHNGVDITDSNFKKIRQLYKPSEDWSYPGVVWSGDSAMLWISEMVDADGEARYVVSSYDIESGNKKKIYETDVNATVIGSNEKYLFVSMNAQYNWAAKEAQVSPEIMNAVRISDGFVYQINSNQVDFADENTQVTVDSSIFYDDEKDLFMFRGTKAADTSAHYFIFARLENNEFGFVLRKVYDAQVDVSAIDYPLFTSKGVLVNENSMPAYPFTVTKDDGTKTALKLIVDTSNILISLKTMPNLGEASSVQPENYEYIVAPESTPDTVIEFLLAKVKCEDGTYSMVYLHNRITEEQLYVLGGCDSPLANYYILKNGKYELVASSGEGLSCEERDKAGISPELADCRLQGEGL